MTSKPDMLGAIAAITQGEAWLVSAKVAAATDLATHGNWLWEGHGTDALARSLRLVAVEASLANARLTLVFEEGSPVRADVTAEYDGSGRLMMCGYTNRVERPLQRAGRLDSEQVIGGLGTVERRILEDGTPQWSTTIADVEFTILSEGAIVTATALAADLARLDREAKEHAARNLLNLRNDDWAEDGEPALGISEFASRMTLAKVEVADDGAVAFSYDDGDLFYGHLISVSYEATSGTWGECSLQG